MPKAGEFMVTASASFKGVKFGEDRQLLVCESVDREMADVRAKPDLMAKISEASHGKVFSATDKETAALASVFGSAPPVTLEYRRTPLWDRSWWLAAILGLLTIEWAVRRWSGLA